MLKQKIEMQFMQALRSKDAVTKNLLSVLKGEIQTIEKNIGSSDLSDEDVMKVITKTVKSLNETISLLLKSDKGNSDAMRKANQELDILKEYLPKQMTKEEITIKVTELFNSGISNIGAIMKEFSSLPADKKVVSETIKEVIK